MATWFWAARSGGGYPQGMADVAGMEKQVHMGILAGHANRLLGGALNCNKWISGGERSDAALESPGPLGMRLRAKSHLYPFHFKRRAGHENPIRIAADENYAPQPRDRAVRAMRLAEEEPSG